MKTRESQALSVVGTKQCKVCYGRKENNKFEDLKLPMNIFDFFFKY